MPFPNWLQKSLEDIPEDLHWKTRRRMAIMNRCTVSRQLEALLDFANGDPTTLADLKADIAAIKAAIPKVEE
jgi:hypothetical protein